MKGFKNTYIYVEKQGIIKTSLSIDNGLIVAIGEKLEDDAIELDDNHILVPGFIDQHIHGCHGTDVMEASEEGLLDMGQQLLQEGVTYFCPTTMSMSIPEICKSLANIARAQKMKNVGAEIVGVHLEGPFLSKKYCGAQPEANIIEADKNVMEQFIHASGNNIRIVTFAPEENGHSIIPTMKKYNITASLGHSDANFTDANQAFDNGVSCITHCYNAMRGFHHRDIGALGAAFLRDDVVCELIADFKHVSMEAIQLLFKVKGPENIILVSDAMEAKYLPEGLYSLGGQTVIVKGETARLKNGALAGSILRLDQALKNIKQTIPSLTFTQIIDLVTKNPARNLKITNIGSIRVGNKARFTVVDKDFNVISTY